MQGRPMQGMGRPHGRPALRADMEMAMDITPLHGELDVLENRRFRLQDMLEANLVSDELRENLQRSLQDVEQRLAICRCNERQQWAQARAA
jgi:hypothetical protein